MTLALDDDAALLELGRDRLARWRNILARLAVVNETETGAELLKSLDVVQVSVLRLLSELHYSEGESERSGAEGSDID